MFNKMISLLIILSLFHVNVAFCMDRNSDDDEARKRPLSPSKKIKLENEENSTPLLLRAADETLPKGERISALKTLLNEHPYCHDLDEDTRKEIDRISLPFLDDEEISLEVRIKLLSAVLDVPSAETLLKLSKALDPYHTSKNVVFEDPLDMNLLISHLIISSDPRIQQKVENFFFEHPENFISDFSMRPWLDEWFEKSDEPQKNLILQKICELTQISLYTNVLNLGAALFVFEHDSSKKFIDEVSNNFFHFIEKTDKKDYQMRGTACDFMLAHSRDPEVRNRICQWLFNEIQKENSPETFKEQNLYLLLLLKDGNLKLRKELLQAPKTFDLLRPMLLSLQEEKTSLNMSLLDPEAILSEEEEDTYSLHSSSSNDESNASLTGGDNSSSHSFLADTDPLEELMGMFLLSPEETERQQAYDYLKSIIINTKNHEKAEDTAEIVIDFLEDFHPWTQEVIQLMVDRTHSKNTESDDSFSIHRRLLEKIKEPAAHHLSTTTLEDGRTVRFNLSALQTPRKAVDLPPVEPSELTRLTRKLMKEIENNPSMLLPFMGEWHPNLLLLTTESPFLKGLLLNNSSIHVGTKYKLRHLLIMAKQSEEKNSSNILVPESNTGLSYSSNLILQLLENVRTCNTGKTTGIDAAYRLITGGLIVSEGIMEGELLQEKAKCVLTEELIKTREGLLNGEGPVAKHFLNLYTYENVPHHATYLKNLLGHQIGTFFEREELSFDAYGKSIKKELRKASLQEVLDVFHFHYTPGKVIEHFLEKFNKRELPEAFISSLITPKELFNNKYAFFENNDPTDDFIRWKPLVVAEVLLRLGILEE